MYENRPLGSCHRFSARGVIRGFASVWLVFVAFGAVAQEAIQTPSPSPAAPEISLDAPEPPNELGLSLDPTATDRELPVAATRLGRKPLRPYREGIFQKFTLSGGVIPRTGSGDDFGMTDMFAGLTLAAPWPSREAPLFFTPSFAQLVLDRGPTTDLPAQLYYSALDISWFKKWNDRYRSVVSVSPGVVGDLRQGSPDPLRIQGMGLVLCDWIPDRLQIAAGVLYLDRDDIPLLPVIGFTYTPAEDWKLEVTVRRNRLARRIAWTDTSEDWAYLTFDWNGNTFAVLRTDGSQDYATLQDFRFMGGWEQKRDGGVGHRIEAGVVFGREVDYRDGGGDFTAEPSAVIQGVMIF